MSDKEYIEYAKAVHDEIYAMSTPMVDGVAGKVLTRIRKEQAKLFKMQEAWTSVMSNAIDVVDVMSVHAHKGRSWNEMKRGIEKILNQYIIDRYEELDPKHHLMLKYRYVGKFNLVTEVKERIYERLGEHYDTQRMQNMLERYPDLNEV